MGDKAGGTARGACEVRRTGESLGRGRVERRLPDKYQEVSLLDRYPLRAVWGGGTVGEMNNEVQ